MPNQGISLVFVAERPVHPTEVLRVQKIQEYIRLFPCAVLLDMAVDAPLADEDRQAVFQAAQDFLDGKFTVRYAGIVVVGVHEVLIRKGGAYGLGKRGAVPRRANENHGVRRVFPNDGNYLACIFCDVFIGGIAVWLVADFVENPRLITVMLCCFLKDGESLIKMPVGILVLKHMPVNDGVEPGCEGIFDGLV